MLPKKYMNISSGIEHQKSSDWCTNHAVSSLLEAQFAKMYNNVTTLSNSWGMMLSKKVDKRPDANGTPIDVLMKEICKYGMCTEELYPTWEDKDYTDNKFLPTTQKMYDVAKKYKPEKFVEIKVNNIEDIKKSVYYDCGCVLIVKVYKEHLFPYKGFVEKPEKGSEPNGLHAIYLCGYIEGVKQTINGKTYENWFILQESYGNTRGHKGYLFVPYEAFTESWTGLYSSDKYIKSAYTFKNSNYKYPDFHNKNDVVFPRRKMTFYVGKKDCFVDGVKKQLSCVPTVINGTTMIPFRFLCENLGYSVNYNSEQKEISAFDKNRSQHIVMKVGSNEIKSQQAGETVVVKSSVPVKVINGNTMIPLRAFSEITKADVIYISKDKKIDVNSMV